MTNFLVQILGVALSLATSKIVLLVAVGLLCLKLYLVHSKGVCRSTQTLEGKTVIVTGGNAGIGKETAKELARRKARVILACRNLEKADKAMQEIFEETQQKVVIKRLDLASLRSVREFADDILKTESRLDVLVNNAGLINDTSKVQLTEDGYEVCFQSNYLGHFLLTILLSELLKKSAPSRVINLSSILHHIGSTADLHDKATGNHSWTHPVLVYSNSKMAMLVFSRALAAKLKPHGVTVNAVHPGPVKTSIAQGASFSVSLFFTFIFNYFGKTPHEGAQTSIYAAVEPSLVNETGKYFVDCRKDLMGWNALGRKRAQEVFEASLKLVQLDPAQVEKQLQSPTS
ncbi:retinol dehydrogenase 11-like [Ixodes scapularis]|uniref:retinol dehydrogenase 11-like n=1 Tax=Ixodes scapularis TaxID=6945 RepID=UPI001C37FC86|nr:retinol dehydrogenase 11-like [Ixodes scapularis]